MKIKFLGAARTVTGSFFVVDTDKTRFAVDCGMFQGGKAIEKRNYSDFPVDPKSIEFLILTHAHIDHSGLIPKLCKSGFTGPIYCSSATEELCRVLLPDSGHIQETEVARKNRKASRANKEMLEPIYTVEDAVNCLPQFSPLNMDEIHMPIPGIELRLRDAGHILGSCVVEVWVEESEEKTKLVFSGDLGHRGQPFVKDPAIIGHVDYLLIESTYGGRFHEETENRSDALERIINDTMTRGGNLIIPSFAVERTQDLLYDLSILYNQGRLDPGISVYIDSPLAIAATQVFNHNHALFDLETIQMIRDGHDPLKLPSLKFSNTTEDSIALNTVRNNTIIISASGMCTAGRIKHHLKHNLWRPECTVLFVGFQAEGSLGRRILDGEKLVTIHGEQVAVKAKIESIPSYSAHADQKDLLEWLGSIGKKPKTVILVHGEEKGQQVLAEQIEQTLQIPTIIPEWLDEVELKPIEVIQPVQVTPATGLQSRDLSKAIAAEEIYFKIRRSLNQLFEARYNNAEYDQLVRELKDLEDYLNQQQAGQQ